MQNFSDKYEIVFPLKTLADFDDFEKKLENQKQMQNDFVSVCFILYIIFK